MRRRHARPLIWAKPVALSLIAILQFIVDDGAAHRIIDQFMDVLPPGSALALSTVTADSAPGEVNAGVAAYNASGIPTKARGPGRGGGTLPWFRPRRTRCHPGQPLVAGRPDAGGR